MKSEALSTRALVRAGLCTAMLCILAPLTIPMGAVPLTLGVFAVMLTALILDRSSAVFAAAVYILMGAVGLPVFSGWKGGFAVLIGPTGGYIWSYIPMMFVICRLKRCMNYGVTLCVCLLSLLVCYTLGTVQYMLVTGTGFYAAVASCVLPFAVFDVVKAMCAARIGMLIRSRMR